VFSTPTVVGSLVFVGSCNGYFRAFDRSTGSLVWMYDTRQDGDPVEFHGDPVLAAGVLIVGCDLRHKDGKGRVYAFDPETGAVRWLRPAGHGVATDLPVHAERVFAATLDDELLALDVASGVPVWSFATGASNDQFFITSTPGLANGRVFFGGLDGVLYALDGETGRVLWKRPLGPRVTTSALAAGGTIYVGTEDNRIHRVNAKDGEVIRSLATEKTPNGRLASAGACVLTFLGEDTLGCVSRDLEKVIWDYTPPGKLSSARPYVWRDFVILGDESGQVLALSLDDGSPRWNVQLEGTVRGIGFAGDAVYAGTLKGLIFARGVPAGNRPD
jgi:outer membrane protein assembly factor BamB